MIFLRPALLICGVALVLALAADLAFFGVAWIFGDFIVGTKHIGWRTGWLLLIAVWLSASVAFAYWLARLLHLFSWAFRS